MKDINQLFYLRTKYKTKLTLFFLYLGLVNPCISQEFTGFIYKKINNQFSIEKKERHELMQKQFGLFKGISYESFIGRKFTFIVCTRDTIIKFSNYKDIPIPYISVEIGKKTYVKGIFDDDFAQLGKFSGYPDPKIKKTNKTFIINGYKTVLYEVLSQNSTSKYYVTASQPLK
ncbi:MAG: hypothetical protein IPL55_01550 [Saprospiraceae bacterium]|jgi:hypothetical protein|nr:hypothetical protein [Saprospiraceae bacterium]